MRDQPGVEWPTLLLYVATLAVWALATSWLWSLSPFLSVLVTGIAIAQFSSLQHEALHGHPFRSPRLNEAMMTPALTLVVPYGRFRDTHLDHHRDPLLTDPYDDPETNFLDPAVWNRLPGALRAVLRANNSLLGRMVIGPILGNALWLAGEARAIAAGRRDVQRDWGLNLLGLVPVVGWLWVAAMPWWGYLLAAWLGHGLLKVRTFLEHRAHESAPGRSVVVEDRGPFALLFLNNNLHAVHHAHPGVAWYRLPALYRDRRDHFLRRNGGYRYRSYAEVFARHFLRAKDPVPHPIWTPEHGPGGLRAARPDTSGETAEGRAVGTVVEEGHAA